MSEKQQNKSEAEEGESGAAASTWVAAGILASRITGLARERVFSYYFGTSVYASVFRAGLRMPNVLQNLLGEGTLSASFIPVYARLLEEGREEEAGRVAGAVFGLLLAVAGGMALLGILGAPLLVSIFLAGYEGFERELTIEVVRILFPMAGVLVLSAWTLGILNSHRRFFIPYVAPVLWNGAMIATMVMLGGDLSQRRLLIALAWGALVGGVLQFAIQLPWALRLAKGLKITGGLQHGGVRETVKNAGPALLGRGVVQVSAWIDMFLASFLFGGAIAILGYAQTLYLLPISLFGMSVAAAELPELSRKGAAASDVLRKRATAALVRMAFFVIPSMVAFLAIGDVLVAALYQTGRFDPSDTLLVYFTLAGYSIGLLASTLTRLFSSTFFALRDTKTPAIYAGVRVLASAVLSFGLMLQFEQVEIGGWTLGPGLFAGVRVGDAPLGVVGLAVGTGLAAWIEWLLLRRALKKRVGAVGENSLAPLLRMVVAALAAGAAGWGVARALEDLHPIPEALFVVGAFGVVYFGIAAALGIGEARRVIERVRRLVLRTG